MGRKRSPIRLRLMCPKCDEPQPVTFSESRTTVDFDCEGCGAQFRALYVKVRAKRSKAWKDGSTWHRDFHVRMYDAAGVEDYLEWTMPNGDEIEMRKNDVVILYSSGGQIQFVENRTISEITEVRRGCSVLLAAGLVLATAGVIFAAAR